MPRRRRRRAQSARVGEDAAWSGPEAVKRSMTAEAPSRRKRENTARTSALNRAGPGPYTAREPFAGAPMSYEYGSESKRLELPNPYQLQNRLLWVCAAVLLIGGVTSLVWAKAAMQESA